MSRYQKGKTNLDFTEARNSEWQWHQLVHMQVCTSLQTDNHASTPPLSFLQAGCPSCRPTNSVIALKAKMNSWSRWIHSHTLGPWLQKMVVYNSILYHVRQRAGDLGIIAENMEKSQRADFNEDVTNESISLACSNIQLWKLDSQKEWRNVLMPLRWKDWDRYCGFHGQKRKQMSGFLTKLDKEGTVRHR